MQPTAFGASVLGQLVPVSVTESNRYDYRTVTTEAWAFLPAPRPMRPPLEGIFERQLEAAAQAIGPLNGLGALLANPSLLIRPFLCREAVASSRIEGTVADLRQLVLFEEAQETEPPNSDVREVFNDVRALEYGPRRPADRPISSVFIRELHHLRVAGVRGGDRGPGQFRCGQVHIGHQGTGIASARFVPPPPETCRA